MRRTQQTAGENSCVTNKTIGDEVDADKRRVAAEDRESSEHEGTMSYYKDRDEVKRRRERAEGGGRRRETQWSKESGGSSG